MSRSRATTLAVLAFAAMTALTAARTVRNLNIPGRPFVELYGMQDFRDNFYYPTVALLDGRNPYDANDYRARYPIDRPLPAYSPISFLVHLPFALLPYRPAEAAYFLAGALLLLALARLALQGAGAEVTTARTFGIGALLLLSRPGHQTLYIGQCTAIVAVGVAMALVLARRRPWIAGVGLAIACLKPSYGLPLGLLMLCRGDRRAFLRGAGLAAAAGALAGIGPVRAAGGLRPFLATVRGSMRIIATDASFHEPSSLIRLDLDAMVGRLLGRPPGALAAGAIAAAVLLVAGILLRRLAAREGDGPRAASTGLACLAILLSMYHQSYDALLLALPAVALALGREGVAWPSGAVPLRSILLALILVPGLNYLATSAFVNLTGPAPWMWLLIANANGAAIFLLFALWPVLAFRRNARGSAP